MKTKYILLTALVAVSCAKTTEAPKSVYESLPADGKEFLATNVPVKSTLDSGGHLHWQESDVIGVYAYNMSDRSYVCANAYPRPDVQGTSATFKSAKNEDDWYEGVEEGGQKAFFAYYPTNGYPIEPKPSDEDQKYLLPFSVEREQNGEFSNNQVMFAYGGKYTKGSSVSFEFTPLTAILRFRIKSSDGTECQIGKLLLELGTSLMEGGSLGSYLNFNGRKRLDGNFAVDIGATIENSSITMHQTEHPSWASGGDYMEINLVKSGKIINVNSYSYSDYIYAVVVPTVNPEPDLILAISAIKFDPDHWNEEDAFTKGGTDVTYGEILRGFFHLKYLDNSSISGFDAGKIYDFNLTLSAGAMDVSHTGTMEFGHYNIIDWGMEQ